MLSFHQFITEAAIAIGDYSLESKYQHFNHSLFGGVLPTIPITWNPNLKTASGRVRARGVDPWGFTGVHQDSIRMEISSLFKSSEDRLDGILVHEMIHVYFMAVKNDGRENHGSNFMHMVSDLQHHVSFTIPISDDITNLNLSDGVRQFDVGVILRHDTRGAWATFIGKTDWLRHGQKLMARMTQRARPGESFTFYYGKTNLHRKYDQATGNKYGMKAMPSYLLNPNDLEAVLALPQQHPTV